LAAERISIVCGLNGLFAFHPAAGALDAAELAATTTAMQARGPDGSGEWWSGDRCCALGHRRLSIIDLSDRASQPMISDNGRLVVVYNGEIYNYRVLRAELETAGVCFRSNSDTEVLLHLYAREGVGMVSRLRGMFAFAIWDDVKRGLFLARDLYGIKPLYTANDGWTFRFASQVKALLAGRRISRDPEPAGIVGFHLFGCIPEPFTLYRDVRALPAGHVQWIDEAGPREPKPIASLAEIVADASRIRSPAAELPERLRTGLRDSVRAHMLADVEVGIFLSAGVDSGALLGVMRDVGQQQVRAITLAFKEFRGTSEDEAPLAAQVAERYEAKQIVRYVSEQEFQRDLPNILEAMDQPSIDGVNTWYVAKAAREAGLKVALSGLGGDELLGGYPSFVTLPRWRRRFGPLASIPGLGQLARLIIRGVAPDLVRTHPKALGVLEYANRWPGTYLLQRGLFLPHELGALMDRDVAREGMRRLKPFDRLAASIVPDPGSAMARVSVLESSNYMRHQLLRDADWAGMAHGVEIRVPLVDVALLKTVAPTFASLIPGAGKAALAHAPLRPLPEELAAREKTGFAVPTGAWIARTADIKPTAAGPRPKGLVSRDWSRLVLSALTTSNAALAL
jgi:asparagine synthase (glutamine-hydrolysing)